MLLQGLNAELALSGLRLQTFTLVQGFNDDLGLGGAVPVGARQANITQDILPFLQEIALDQQVCLMCCVPTNLRIP